MTRDRRDTSADVAARWRGEARVRMNAPDASYAVVLGLGTNDATEEDGAVRVEPRSAVDNLGRIIDVAQEIGLDVFVVGPPPAGEPARDERVCELSDRFGRLASNRAVPFVETFRALRDADEWTREAGSGDGSHPGAGGYCELAEIVLAGGFLRWATPG